MNFGRQTAAALGTAAAALVLLAASSGTAAAQGTSAGGGATIPKLQFEKYTLPNGLEVILHEDHSTPVVAVDTWFKVGSADEQPGRTGFAHLFEHIMFMGSEHVPTGQFDQLLEAAGANNNGSTNTDRTNYYEWMPSNALPLALWLDADRMGALLPPLDLPKVNLQRDVVKNERRQRVDNVPYGRADETIIAALFPKGHPFSWPVIGSMADLSAASLDDVKSFFRTYYAPNNATLTIAGDFDPDSAKAWVQRYYGAIPRGTTTATHAAPTPVVVPRDTFLVLEDKVQLPRIFYNWIGVPLYSPDDAALDVLSYVLAGDKNSRLYKRLVYSMQVAQDVEAYNDDRRIGGMFQVNVTPKPTQTPAALDRLVNEEIAKVIAAPISDRELARAKNTFLARSLDRLASVNGKADQLNMYNYIAGNPDYVQQDAARYAAVTAADVQRVARQYLGAHKVVLTVVPEGKKDTMVQGVTP